MFKKNEISVRFEFSDDVFIIYDKNYNKLADGLIYVNYEDEINYFYLGLVEVHDNFIFENNKRLENLVFENFGFGNTESNIELTDLEMNKYNSKYGDFKMMKIIKIGKSFYKKLSLNNRTILIKLII